MEADPRRRGGPRQALRATGDGRARRARWARSHDFDPRRRRGRPDPAGRRRLDQPACPRRGPRRPTRAGPLRHPAARDQRGRGRQLRRADPAGVRAVARIRGDRHAPGDRLGEPGRRCQPRRRIQRGGASGCTRSCVAAPGAPPWSIRRAPRSRPTSRELTLRPEPARRAARRRCSRAGRGRYPNLSPGRGAAPGPASHPCGPRRRRPGVPATITCSIPIGNDRGAS